MSFLSSRLAQFSRLHLLTAALGCLAIAALVGTAIPQNAQAQGLDFGLTLNVSEVKVYNTGVPIASVAVGDSLIADARPDSPTSLFIFGRSQGTTSILLLDKDGNLINDLIVNVTQSRGSVLSLYRGSDRSSFNCSPDCQPTARLGDSSESYNEALQQIQALSNARGESTEAKITTQPRP